MKVFSVTLIRFCMIYAYTMLRYQVSVFRTIVPLVSICDDNPLAFPRKFLHQIGISSSIYICVVA